MQNGYKRASVLLQHVLKVHECICLLVTEAALESPGHGTRNPDVDKDRNSHPVQPPAPIRQPE